MRVLLVEHNRRHAAAICADMNAEAVRVDIAETGDDAIYLMRDYEFDLVLLNIALPDMDGNSLINRIRAAKNGTPIIALSSMPQARLKALTAGADDVVERDIDRVELGARSRGFSQSQLQVGSLALDVDQQDVVANGVRVQFTPREFAVLQLLVLRRNMIMTKEAIFSPLYGGKDEPDIKIIDVFVCKIRSKLAKAGVPAIISTVWGRGYSVKDKRSDAPGIAPRPQPVRTEKVVA